MTKEQAQRDTIKRFTNLIDGKVLPFISVFTILSHYEMLLSLIKPPVVGSCNITKQFEEEAIRELEQEADYYDGEL